jgi:type I restriction enzyme S subunit
MALVHTKNPRTYRETAAGYIPTDWEVRKVSEFTHCTSGGTPSTLIPENWGGSIKWMSSGELHQKNIFDVAERITERGLQNSSAKVIPKNSVLIGLAGQGKTRGTAAISRVELCTNQSIAAILPSEAHDSNYLYYSLDRRYRELRSLSTGGEGRGGLNLTIIRNLAIAFPNRAEQSVIADALSDVDALIKRLEDLMEKKKNIKRGIMSELLTGRRRLPGFSQKWKKQSFVDVLLRLNAKSHQISARDYQSVGRYPIVDQGKDRITGYSDRQEKLFTCPDSGVIVFGDHTCIVKFIDFDFLVGADGTQILIAKKGYSARFLAFQLEYRGIEPTGYNRHFKLLKEREFNVPLLDEQIRISMLLSDAEAEIKRLEQILSKYRKFKEAMMQQLLTGKIRLV